MRLVYVDEAGISNPAQEPFLVVAGVVIHASNLLVAVERQLEKVVARHIKPEHQDGFIFHAKELFNGGGKVFKRDGPQPYPLAKRLEIADDIAAIPHKFNLPLAIGFLGRAKFPSADAEPDWEKSNAAERAIISHVTAFMGCAMFVEQWMRRDAPNEVCMMIVEDNEQARAMIRQSQISHQDPKMKQFLDEKARKHFPFRKIKEEPLFQPKRPSSVLQLADFCAYVFKRMLMEANSADKRYARFSAQMLPNAITFDEI